MDKRYSLEAEMNIEQLAKKLSELGINQAAYRLGRYGGGGSDALHLREESGRFSIFYSERGQDDLLASFQTESEACEYLLGQLKSDPSYSAHNVGIFSSESQAKQLAAKLSSKGIAVKTDVIPVSATEKRYRVFVYGPDILKVKEVRGW